MTSPRRRASAIACAVAWALAAGSARAAEPPARPGPSEYRLYAGVRHRTELFTADVLTTGRLLLRGVDAVESRLDAPWALPSRAAGLVLVDLPIVSYTLVVPHEALGHAERYRQFDADAAVHLDAPLPFSLRADHFVTLETARRRLYPGEESLVHLGGLGAQEASQRMLAATVSRSGALRRGEALLYESFALTHAAQTLYGADLVNASSLVAAEYRGDPRAYRTTARAALVLDLVDPMLFASLVKSMRWLVTGEDVARAPGLRVGPARLFATSRTTPVPWGTEHSLHVLASLPWAWFDLGVRTGFGSRSSFGVELATRGLRVLQVMRLGAEGALFAQPVISSEAELGPPPVIVTAAAPRRRTSLVGAAARLLLEVDRGTWSFGTRLGYKTAGLWGERDLAAGFDVALTGSMRFE